MTRQSLSFPAFGGGLLALLYCIALPALARGAPPCAVQSVAGSWVFATEVGQQAFPIDADGDITAIGTLNIDAEGRVEGVFDNTIAEFRSRPDLTYSGSITVSPDCRGVLTFVTSSGMTRIDSIVVVSRNEMLGMSRDTNNLWTYQVRRISSSGGLDALSAKVDAIMRRMGFVPGAYEP